MSVNESCGCGEGKWSPDLPILVSVRCVEHREVPPLEGHRLVSLDADGRAVFGRARKRPKMAIPGKRRR